MPILRKGSRAWHRARASLPKPDPGGTWFRDPDSGREVFIPWEHLHLMCRDIMDPKNADFVEADLGKMHFSKDPTYNLKGKS